jgi:hypothetical protein
MRVYLFGPMRNYRDFNFPAFRKAAELLEAAGHEVFSPATRDIEEGFDPAGDGSDLDLESKGFDLRSALCADLSWICKNAEAIVGLPVWESSAGSRAEVHAAWALKIPVFDLSEFLLYGPEGREVRQPY